MKPKKLWGDVSYNGAVLKNCFIVEFLPGSYAFVSEDGIMGRTIEILWNCKPIASLHLRPHPSLEQVTFE